MVKPRDFPQMMTGVIAIGLVILVGLDHNSWIQTTLSAIVASYLGFDVGVRKPWKG